MGEDKKDFIQSIAAYHGLYGRKWIVLLMYKWVLQLVPVFMFVRWDWNNGFEYEKFISWIEDLSDNSSHLLQFGVICIYIAALLANVIVGFAVFDKEYYLGFIRRLIVRWSENEESDASPLHLQKFYETFQ